MSKPPRYGIQTAIGAAVILMGLGFVGAQLLAPKASTANNTQAVAARSAPRIIEINTRRIDNTEANSSEPKRVEPIKPLDEPVAPPTPNFTVPGTPPVSAAELKRKAQEEAPRIAEGTADIPPDTAGEQRRKTPSRVRYPAYDRHAVY